MSIKSWHERLEIAEKQGKFTDEDREKARHMATSPVNDRNALKSSAQTGRSKEKEQLILLAICCYDFVKSDCIQEAKGVYESISTLSKKLNTADF